jgi:PAS domain S-box-containing protein
MTAWVPLSAPGREAVAEAVLDAIEEGLIALDRDFRVASINRAGLAIDGRPAREILGRTLWDAWPAVRGTPFEAACRRAMEQRVPQEATLRGPDGETWLELRAYPSADGLALLYRDVTARRRDEARLRESEARLRLAIEALHGAIYDYDPAADRTERSGAYEEIVGIRAEDLPPAKEGWLSRVHPDDIGPMRAVLATVYEGTADRFEVEYRVRHRDGHWVHCWQRSIALRDAAGRLQRVVGSIVDVSAQRAAEAALRESEARFRTFTEHAPDTIYIVDGATRRLEYINPAFERIWGEPRAAVMADLGRWRALLHPEDRARVLAAFDGLIARGQPVDTEYRILRASDGAVRHIRDTAVPLSDATGRVTRVIGIAHDATARKLAEQHRELLIRELNHRVKNTLATVQSIAAQTLSSGCDVTVRDAFAARLLSLAGAHDLLTRGNWEGSGLEEVARQALGPHMGGGRIALSGPDLRLSPKAAVALGMAFHELATNAAKYGALSVPEGRAALDWRIQDEALDLRWTERGGPPVVAPTHRGFGTRLLERGLPHELHGQLRMEFRPEGLACTITAPLSALSPAMQEMG